MKNTARTRRLIETLEARIVPATFVWNMNADGNWNDPNNWFNQTTNMVDGFPNGPDDVAKFEGVITADRTVVIPEAVKLSIGQIVFNDDNTYTLAPENAMAGLQINRTGATATITNDGAATPIITVPLILQANLSIEGAGGLQIAAPISESVVGRAVLMNSTGTLTLGDGTTAYSNSYTGDTSVQAGVLELNVNGTAIPGQFSVGNSATPSRAELLRGDQISDSANVRLFRNGTLDLNGNDEALGILFLQPGDSAGATITGTGTLTLLGNLQPIGISGTGAIGALISANLDLPAGAHAFTVSDGAADADLTITGVISGDGSITSSTAGTLHLGGSAPNIFTGGLTVSNGGTVVLAKPGGWAATKSAFIAGTLRLGSPDQVSGSVTVTATGTFDLDGRNETLSSISLASGATGGAVVNTGAGTLTLSDPNGGQTLIALSTSSGGAAGAAINGNLTLAGNSIRLNIADGSAADDLTINGTISGTASIERDGAGNLFLAGPNAFTSAMTIFSGTVTAAHSLALGGTGTASGTRVNPGATLVIAPGVSLADERISLQGTGSAGGALVGGAGASSGAFIRLLDHATITAPATFGFSGEIGALDDATRTLTVDTMATTMTLSPGATVSAQLNGTVAGTGFDQIKVIGGVNLAGAALKVGIGFTASDGTTFVIVDNDGSDAVTGTFAGLAEGATVHGGGRKFIISYTGGDGNDVMLTALPFDSDLDIATDGKSATFTDVDGDLVTVKVSKGTLTAGDFKFSFAADNRHRLDRLVLDGAENLANVTLTARRTANGGNGFVNIEHLDATGVDLGMVKIAGDLGRVTAGTPGGDAKVPGIKSLEAQSISLIGTTGGVAYASVIEGALPKLVTKGDLRGSVSAVGADGKLGTVTVGGSFRAGATGVPIVLSGDAGIGAVNVAGDIIGSSASLTIRSSAGAIGSITTGGSFSSATIEAFGAATAPANGVDIALGKLVVKGAMQNSIVRAGAAGTGNADASIGSIVVGGQWRYSTVMAGVTEGADTFAGTADDAALSGAGVRDHADIVSTISGITIGGQAIGSASAGDMYGIVAGKIGKAKIGTRAFAFTNGATPEAFFAAPTGAGMGTENPAFDFTLRELGAATPAPSFGGVNLDISSDGKTATYTDADGDRVTVKRSVGAFAMGDFTIAANASGGGMLQTLTVTPAPGNAAVNLSITAKPGANGGNSFVNVGNIAANGAVLGSVVVGGDLAQIDGGLSVNGKPGIALLAAHSIGEWDPLESTCRHASLSIL